MLSEARQQKYNELQKQQQEVTAKQVDVLQQLIVTQYQYTHGRPEGDHKNDSLEGQGNSTAMTPEGDDGMLLVECGAL